MFPIIVTIMQGFASTQPCIDTSSGLLMKILSETVHSGAIAHSLLDKIRTFLSHCGLPDALQGKYDSWIYIAIVAIAAFAAMTILRLFLSYLLIPLRRRKKGTLIREIADEEVVAHLLWGLPPLAVLVMSQLAITQETPGMRFVERLCAIVVVCITVWTINTLITAIWNVISIKGDMRNRPMKGLAQIIQGIFIAIGVIISVSILINRSPTALITGLGAFAAVLMLVFKDTILGFVSGVQLSQYDMVRKGDWIEIPGTPVNGTVLDVTLNTVKVQNFDNTYITLPPYTLVSQSVQNWRGMTESGGRRIMRSYTIDLNTVRFCTPEMLDSLSQIELLKPYIQQKRAEQAAGNTINTDDPTGAVNGTIDTNLGLFRAYLVLYLKNSPYIHNEDYTLMVRSLEPTENGIPLQIYCFTRTTDWVSYESIQSEIFEHIAAIMPRFELYPFQNASGRDYITQSLISAGYRLGHIAGAPYGMTHDDGTNDSSVTPQPSDSSPSTTAPPPTP